MLISTVSSHVQIQNAGFHTVKFTNFINCKAENGGAIYCYAEGTREITFCYFLNCSATHESTGRGGAILFGNGYNTIKNCCSDTIHATLGGDFQEFGGLFLLYQQISTTKCYARSHPTYFSCNKIHADSINISLNNLKMDDFYGNAIVFGKSWDSEGMFINAINNTGQKSIFSFEYCNQTKQKLSYSNAMFNEYSEGLVGVYKLYDVSILIANTIFSSNLNNNILFINLYSNISIEYNNCSFDFKYDSSGYEELLTFISCTFEYKMHSNNYEMVHCIMNYKPSITCHSFFCYQL